MNGPAAPPLPPQASGRGPIRSPREVWPNEPSGSRSTIGILGLNPMAMRVFKELCNSPWSRLPDTSTSPRGPPIATCNPCNSSHRGFPATRIGCSGAPMARASRGRRLVHALTPRPFTHRASQCCLGESVQQQQRSQQGPTGTVLQSGRDYYIASEGTASEATHTAVPRSSGPLLARAQQRVSATSITAAAAAAVAASSRLSEVCTHSQRLMRQLLLSRREVRLREPAGVAALIAPACLYLLH